MILGKIFGKVTTNKFKFVVDSDTQNFEYVQVYHKRYGYVLCQIIELERDSERLIAKCVVLGYKDDDGKVRGILEPFNVGAEVLYADDDFVKKIVMLDADISGGFIGKLRGRDIPINLDLQKLLTKHLAVLAKSGAGKSYFVGCLLEEVIEKKVPLLLIDTHGEYISLKHKNDSDKEVAKMAQFGVKPQGYNNYIVEYGDPEYNPESRPLQFFDQLTPQEIMMMLPSKLSMAQENLLYAVMKDVTTTTFDDLIFMLDQEESPVKNQIINMLQMLKGLNLFSASGLDFNELIQSGRCSIINLRGIAPDTQELIVSKLMKDLFEMRKKNLIPPFFAVIEEAHNFCPERSFGQTRSSNVIRNIASEGRKFGMGLGVISQRPARIDKSVLSQVTTQVILKITNPNDLKAIMNSVEGVSSESESEIKGLPIGSGVVTGVVDMPLFVDIRPRKSLHGGTSVNMLEHCDDSGEDFFEKLDEFNEESEEVLPVVMPGISKKDYALMQEDSVSGVEIDMVPAVLCRCKERDKEYSILIERVNGEVVKNLDMFECGILPRLKELSSVEVKVLEKCFYKKRFKLEEFVSEFGFGFGVRDVLSFLVEKQYLLCDGDEFELNSRVVLSNLSAFESFSKIEFKKVPYREKLLPAVSIDNVKKSLDTFVEVVDLRECFIGRYSCVKK